MCQQIFLRVPPTLTSAVRIGVVGVWLKKTDKIRPNPKKKKKINGLLRFRNPRTHPCTAIIENRGVWRIVFVKRTEIKNLVHSNTAFDKKFFYSGQRRHYVTREPF